MYREWCKMLRTRQNLPDCIVMLLILYLHVHPHSKFKFYNMTVNLIPFHQEKKNSKKNKAHTL